MDDDAGAQAPQLLWINWTDQVVSFHPEEGFEPVAFPDPRRHAGVCVPEDLQRLSHPVRGRWEKIDCKE